MQYYDYDIISENLATTSPQNLGLTCVVMLMGIGFFTFLFLYGHNHVEMATTIDPDLVTSTQETPVVGESDDYSEIN